MGLSSPKGTIARFGLFEADFGRRLLLKNGLRVKLQEQPFQLLGLLLERPGDIVTREEIRQKLWSADTFVEFDDGLNTAIKKLRAALGDSADNPRFIETVPRRGYRFLAPVILPPHDLSAVTAPSSPERPPEWTAGRSHKLARAKMWAVPLAGVVLLTAILVTGWMTRSRHRGLEETDSILLVDFANSTGEPIFDSALREATAVELGQSPFLNLVSNDRVRETLRSMSRSPDDQVQLPLAREVCERVGAKVYIAGSVGHLGAGYLLAIKAVNCGNDTTVAREQAQANNKEALLPALDEVASKIRRELGESLSSIRKFDVPIEEATTQSLEALKAYSLGMDQRARGFEEKSIPFFDHAIELDPNFTMAYVRRAAAYGNLGETERAIAEIKKAYERRANLSEREKLLLTVRYADADKGDTRKVIETYQVWHQLYPRELQPLNGLAARYQVIGEFDKAVEAAREALMLRPDNYMPYANLASSYESLNRLEEAKQICAKALGAQRDSLHTHDVSFEIAYLENDQATMQREMASAKGTNREANIVFLQGLVLASAGRLRLARPIFEHSYAKRRENQLDDFAAYAMAVEALIEADFGFEKRARNQALQALKIGHGIDAEEAAAEVLSLTGRGQQALSLVDDLHTRFPLHVPLNPACLPTILATVEIRKGNPAKAVQVLQQAIPYDLSEFANLAPPYIRGQAYLRLGDGRGAAAEFQKFTDHTGLNVLTPRHSLALLGMARAYALMHETAKALKAYEDFFALWSEADNDIPVLVQAKMEYQRLGGRRN
jgi:DNA-binding winged helix-turn-helix (wHTH) protein/tetratricopeptide (TPR) repeat protein